MMICNQIGLQMIYFQTDQLTLILRNWKNLSILAKIKKDCQRFLNKIMSMINKNNLIMKDKIYLQENKPIQ